jgi:hypothetical protein
MSLVGLSSADFLVDGERFGCWKSIHAGKLVTASRHPSGAKAAEIVYAEDDIPSLPSCCPCATVVD